MKRTFKIILFVIIVFVVMIISGAWIYHKYALSKEIKDTPPPGEMVVVNDHNMHVYTEGEGQDTIVFMSGGGTSSPVLDFKALWSILSKEHRIAVVEKAGYGWSDVANVSRDMDTILEETRTALKRVGEEPPYVLAAHSMSGIEAIYWAQHYPDEVEAIIGLDPAIPEAYHVMDIPPSFVQSVAAFAARAGLFRLFPSVVNSQAVIESGRLSSKDEATYRALFHRRTLTANMREEVKQVEKNAEKVEEGAIPTDIPVYFFISDGKEIGIKNWREMLADYTKKFSEGEYLYMDTDHYVHAYKPTFIATEIERFLKDLNTK